MRGEGIPTPVLPPVEVKKGAFGRAVLYVIPGIVVTTFSVLLFAQLTGLDDGELNRFSVIILTAIIFSLLSATLMQILIYRINEDKSYFADGGAVRSIRMGVVYSLLSTLVVSGGIYLALKRFAMPTDQEFLFFVALHFFFSGTWVLTSVFWAQRRYLYPSVIYLVAYALVFINTYAMYLVYPDQILTGFTIGIAMLFLFSLLVAVVVFPRPQNGTSLWDDLTHLPALDAGTAWAILFTSLYVIAIFLDKIIVWIYQGQIAGTGIYIGGIYTFGSFLGLIPLFSIGGIAYFQDRTRHLAEHFYKGTRSEIDARAEQYKRIYQQVFTATLLLACFLAALVVALTYRFTSDNELVIIVATVSVGSVFLSGIVFNSVILPVFGPSYTSTLAASIVVVGVLAMIPLVSVDTWYAALGFLGGAAVGFLVSGIVTIRYLSRFEFRLYHYISEHSLRKFNQQRSYLS